MVANELLAYQCAKALESDALFPHKVHRLWRKITQPTLLMLNKIFAC